MFMLSYEGEGWYFSGKFDDYGTPLCLYNPNDERIPTYASRKAAEQVISDNPSLKKFKIVSAKRVKGV